MGTGKSKEETVKEKAREWQRQIRGESRRIERDVTRMRQEEEKLKKEISGLQKALLSFKTMVSGYVLRLNEAIHVVHGPIRRSRPWQRRARLPARGPRAFYATETRRPRVISSPIGPYCYQMLSNDIYIYIYSIYILYIVI